MLWGPGFQPLPTISLLPLPSGLSSVFLVEASRNERPSFRPYATTENGLYNT